MLYPAQEDETVLRSERMAGARVVQPRGPDQPLWALQALTGQTLRPTPQDSIFSAVETTLSPEEYQKALSSIRINHCLGELVQPPRVMNGTATTSCCAGRRWSSHPPSRVLNHVGPAGTRILHPEEALTRPPSHAEPFHALACTGLQTNA